MILHTQPKKPWTEHDFLLLEAYQIVLSEQCPHCGYPVWICHNDDGDIGFDIVEDVCYAERERETVDKQKSSSKGYEAPPGTKAKTIALRYSKKPFDWEMREAYYKAEYAKQHPGS